MLVSVIIPVFNEEKYIESCLHSLSRQSYSPLDIIVIDDGSEDKSKIISQKLKTEFHDLHILILSQEHKGPGEARNFGTKHARGEILVFVDADMTFDKEFINQLILPIRKGVSRGTFTKEEYVSNWENAWARCWNYNQGIGTNRRIPENFIDQSPVFRAIKKSEFVRAGGFDPIGYTDDWTLSRKLRYGATLSNGAVCYHQNPESLGEVFEQAQWIGRNEFISGSMIRRILNSVRFNPVSQLVRSLLLLIKYGETRMPVFCWVYYWGIWRGIVSSFLYFQKNK